MEGINGNDNLLNIQGIEFQTNKFNGYNPMFAKDIGNFEGEMKALLYKFFDSIQIMLLESPTFNTMNIEKGVMTRVLVRTWDDSYDFLIESFNKVQINNEIQVLFNEIHGNIKKSPSDHEKSIKIFKIICFKLNEIEANNQIEYAEEALSVLNNGVFKEWNIVDVKKAYQVFDYMLNDPQQSLHILEIQNMNSNLRKKVMIASSLDENSYKIYPILVLKDI